ncbi:four-helix bundle copper-binding protein [Litorilituus lipolyticus]|uniref:Four-helix bundle copper-binding protein n=1 Tax=Litorilituus lipolyticus TaxID=2491017 RepID=A0A502L3G9_9GAMM|nr:four-helix bundle copper-binding protein [Litorilituus lipolyticus]TPH18478.1 four-helix bundle copper-binding protein [Litorilituus lipolyticus]
MSIDTGNQNARRNLLKGIVASTAAIAAAPVMANNNHAHHHHMPSKLNKALIAISNECAQHGDECIAHCMQMFKMGDTTLAKCAETVNEMIIMCRALAKMASYQSTQVNALAKIVIDVCQVCADECGKHTKHKECKACEQSCLECIEECKKLFS